MRSILRERSTTEPVHEVRLSSRSHSHCAAIASWPKLLTKSSKIVASSSESVDFVDPVGKRYCQKLEICVNEPIFSPISKNNSGALKRKSRNVFGSCRSIK